MRSIRFPKSPQHVKIQISHVQIAIFVKIVNNGNFDQAHQWCL
jgi:hypothetical protein